MGCKKIYQEEGYGTIWDCKGELFITFDSCQLVSFMHIAPISKHEYDDVKERRVSFDDLISRVARRDLVEFRTARNRYRLLGISCPTVPGSEVPANPAALIIEENHTYRLWLWQDKFYISFHTGEFDYISPISKKERALIASGWDGWRQVKKSILERDQPKLPPRGQFIKMGIMYAHKVDA